MNFSGKVFGQVNQSYQYSGPDIFSQKLVPLCAQCAENCEFVSLNKYIADGLSSIYSPTCIVIVNSWAEENLKNDEVLQAKWNEALSGIQGIKKFELGSTQSQIQVAQQGSQAQSLVQIEQEDNWQTFFADLKKSPPRLAESIVKFMPTCDLLMTLKDCRFHNIEPHPVLVGEGKLRLMTDTYNVLAWTYENKYTDIRNLVAILKGWTPEEWVAVLAKTADKQGRLLSLLEGRMDRNNIRIAYIQNATDLFAVAGADQATILKFLRYSPEFDKLILDEIYTPERVFELFKVANQPALLAELNDYFSSKSKSQSLQSLLNTIYSKENVVALFVAAGVNQKELLLELGKIFKDHPFIFRGLIIKRIYAKENAKKIVAAAGENQSCLLRIFCNAFKEEPAYLKKLIQKQIYTEENAALLFAAAGENQSCLLRIFCNAFKEEPAYLKKLIQKQIYTEENAALLFAAAGTDQSALILQLELFSPAMVKTLVSNIYSGKRAFDFFLKAGLFQYNLLDQLNTTFQKGNAYSETVMEVYSSENAVQLFKAAESYQTPLIKSVYEVIDGGKNREFFNALIFKVYSSKYAFELFKAMGEDQEILLLLLKDVFKTEPEKFKQLIKVYFDPDKSGIELFTAAGKIRLSLIEWLKETLLSEGVNTGTVRQ